MKLLTTLFECDWITGGVAEMSSGTKHTVAHCLPTVFQSYAKIFHPIHEDISIQNDQLTWQEEEKAKSSVLEPKTETEQALANIVNQSTLVYGGAPPGSRLLRIRWAELARRLGMPFVPTLRPLSS